MATVKEIYDRFNVPMGGDLDKTVKGLVAEKPRQQEAARERMDTFLTDVFTDALEDKENMNGAAAFALIEKRPLAVAIVKKGGYLVVDRDFSNRRIFDFGNPYPKVASDFSEATVNENQAFKEFSDALQQEGVKIETVEVVMPTNRDSYYTPGKELPIKILMHLKADF